MKEKHFRLRKLLVQEPKRLVQGTPRRLHRLWQHEKGRGQKVMRPEKESMDYIQSCRPL